MVGGVWLTLPSTTAGNPPRQPARGRSDPSYCSFRSQSAISNTNSAAAGSFACRWASAAAIVIQGMI